MIVAPGLPSLSTIQTFFSFRRRRGLSWGRRATRARIDPQCLRFPNRTYEAGALFVEVVQNLSGELDWRTKVAGQKSLTIQLNGQIGTKAFDHMKRGDEAFPNRSVSALKSKKVSGNGR